MGEIVDRPEGMAEFFDARADGYEAHMREVVSSFNDFYQGIAAPIPATEEPIRLLDLGCGTGLELAGIFAKAPRAMVTGGDLSAAMLRKLWENYPDRRDRLELIHGSYLAMEFGESRFDYVVSVMAMHHLPPEPKRRLYTKIKTALKPGGLYIEGDYIAENNEEEGRMLATYNQQIAGLDGFQEGAYHIDIPFTVETQIKLLLEAGFATAEPLWREGPDAIFTAKRG